MYIILLYQIHLYIYNPKDGDLYLIRMNSNENLMEVRMRSNVQIDAEN